MKNRLVPIGAILVLLSSTPLMAAEPPFHAPSTHRAQESAQLFNRAARALSESAPQGSRISELWLFPTDDPNTVFAQFRLGANEHGVPTEHLVELTLQGDRVVALRDLTDASAAPLAAKVGRP